MLGVAVRIVYPNDALADPLPVVGDQEQSGAMIAFQMIVRRYVVGGVIGQECLPLVELPGVEQRRLVIEEILDLGARDHIAGRDRHCAAPIRSFQRRQKIRKWCSSLLSCSLSLP